MTAVLKMKATADWPAMWSVCIVTQNGRYTFDKNGWCAYWITRDRQMVQGW